MRQNNNAPCRNFCEATGECLIDAIQSRSFDGERVYRLAEYIVGPQIDNSLHDYFQDQMASYYEPEHADAYEEETQPDADLFIEDINASLAPDEDPYTTIRVDYNQMVRYSLDPFVWRQRGIQCARYGANFMVSTIVNINGVFETIAEPTNE